MTACWRCSCGPGPIRRGPLAARTADRQLCALICSESDPGLGMKRLTSSSAPARLSFALAPWQADAEGTSACCSTAKDVD